MWFRVELFFFYGGTFVHKVAAATCWWTVNHRKLCTEVFFKNTNTIPGYGFFRFCVLHESNGFVGASLGSPYLLIFLRRTLKWEHVQLSIPRY